MRNLVGFGQVRIEVVLAVKFGVRIYLAVQREAGQNGPLNGLLVGDRQSTRMPETNGADGRVWLFVQLFVQIRTAAEHFAFGIELDVDFQADDDVVHIREH